MDYPALKKADAALGIADPVAAAEALNAQTRTVALGVATADMRAELWRGLAYSRLVVLASDLDPNSPRRQLADIAITAVSLLNSDRTIDSVGDWLEIAGALQALAAAQQIPQSNVNGVLALRQSVEVPVWPDGVTDQKILYVRSLT